MLSRLVIAFVGACSLLVATQTAAKASCAAAASRVAAQPNTRVVSVQAAGANCRVRVIVQKPGERPRSRVVVVRR